MTVVGNHTENDKMMNYNGVSWDGFPSFADLINSQAYSEGNGNQMKISKPFQKQLMNWS